MEKFQKIYQRVFINYITIKIFYGRQNIEFTSFLYVGPDNLNNQTYF